MSALLWKALHWCTKSRCLCSIKNTALAILPSPFCIINFPLTLDYSHQHCKYTLIASILKQKHLPSSSHPISFFMSFSFFCSFPLYLSLSFPLTANLLVPDNKKQSCKDFLNFPLEDKDLLSFSITFQEILEIILMA